MKIEVVVKVSDGPDNVHEATYGFDSESHAGLEPAKLGRVINDTEGFLRDRIVDHVVSEFGLRLEELLDHEKHLPN